MREIVLAHAAATLFLVGLIWFVQIVHYPLMSLVSRAGFANYEAGHTRRTGWIVAPLMLAEMALAVVLVVRPPAGVAAPSVWFAAGLLGVIWLSTAFIQIPLHRRLARGFDASAHRGLVSSNWIRTSAWTVRGILSIGWLG